MLTWNPAPDGPIPAYIKRPRKDGRISITFRYTNGKRITNLISRAKLEEYRQQITADAPTYDIRQS